MRRFLVAALVASGIVVGASGTVRIPNAEAQTVCGAVLLHSNQWLQGAGVDVHSNGPNQFTGVSCNGVSVSTPIAQYGYGWQCVELAARLYRVMNWGRVFANGGAAAGNYRYGAQYLPEGSPSLRFYPVTSSYVPIPGDLVIEAGATYGHVSVVDHVEHSLDGTTQIIAAEENASLTGWHIYQRGNGTMTGGYHPIKGFLHSPLNTHVDKGGARRGFVTSMVSPAGTLVRESTFGFTPMIESLARGTSPVSVPNARGSYATAYVDPQLHVWYIDGQGRRFDTGVIAATGVSPALQLDSNDSPTIAVEASDHTLVVWRTTGALHTGYATRAAMNPSLTLDSSGRYAVAYVTATQGVSVATAAGTTDTGLVTTDGSNPAIAFLSDGTLMTYVANATGLLQSATADTNGTFTLVPPLAVTARPRTSPVLAPFGTRGFEVAYVNAQGQLRLFGTLGGLAPAVTSDTLISSPSLSIRNDGMVVAAATATDGHVWRFNKSAATRSSLAVSISSVPSILLLH